MLMFTMHADVRDLIASDDPAAMAGLEIHFDLNISSSRELMRVTDGSPRPYLLANTKRVTGYIRSDGRMYDTRAVSAVPYDLNDPGELGVRLLANAPDLNLDGDVSYHVSGGMTINGREWTFYPFDTPATPSVDTTLDLASIAPGPGHTLVGVPELGLVDLLSDMTAIGKLVARAATQAAGRSAINAASLLPVAGPYSYDGHGNPLTTPDGETLTWESDGGSGYRLHTVTVGSTTRTFSYNGDGTLGSVA